MAINLSIDALDSLFGYDPDTHSIKGAPTLGQPGPAGLGDPNAEKPAARTSPSASPPLSAPTVQAAGAPPAITGPVMPNLAKPTTSQSNAAGKAEYQAGAPTVSATPNTPEYGEQRQELLDYQKAHPWGSAVSEHPGVWGKIGHVASRVGNIAGDILDPAATERIPGSDLNRSAQEKENAGWVAQGEENELKNAQTGEAEANTWKALNPEPKPDTKEELPAEENQWLKDNPGKTIEDYHTAISKSEAAGKPVAKEPDQQEQIIARLAPLGLKPTFAADGSVSSMQQIPGFKEPEKGTFGGAYAAVRSLEESAREFPAMFKPLLEKMNETQGLGLKPADIDAATENFTAGLATSGGQPLGTASRLNPTGQTESQAQMADKVLNELPRINKEIDAAAENVGPVQGRLMVGFLLGKVGSTGNKNLDNTLTQLRTDVTLLESAGSKFHVGTQKAIDDLAQDIDAGKSSADALHGFTTSIQHWAQQAQKEGKEVSGRGEPPRPANVPSGYQFNANGPKGPGWYRPNAAK